MNNSYFTKRSLRVNQFVLYNICCYHPIMIKKWCTDFRIRQKRCQTRPSKECKSLIWIPIICKRPVHPDDHLQEASPPPMIVCICCYCSCFCCCHCYCWCCYCWCCCRWEGNEGKYLEKENQIVSPTDLLTNRQGKFRAICLFEGWKIEGRDLQYCTFASFVSICLLKKLSLLEI